MNISSLTEFEHQLSFLYSLISDILLHMTGVLDCCFSVFFAHSDHSEAIEEGEESKEEIAGGTGV